MDQNIIEHYFSTAVATGSQGEAITFLLGCQKQIPHPEYDIIRGKINYYFLPKPAKQEPPKAKPDATKAPICWDWFEEQEIPEMNWLVRELGLSPGPVSMLVGFSNVGKGWFSAHLAYCVVHGKPVLGALDVQSTGKVLHLDWDQGEKYTKLWYWRTANGMNLKSFEGIDYYSPTWNLHDIGLDELVKLLKDYKLCIIDCFTAAIPGADLNEDKIRTYVDLLNKASALSGCVVLVLHHEPKSAASGNLKKPKGSGSIISAAGGSIHLTAEEGSPVISIELGKRRLVAPYQSFFTIEDCGEMSPKLLARKGIQLVPCVDSDTHREQQMVAGILGAIQASPGIIVEAIKQRVIGGNSAITKCLKELIIQQLVRVEGEKPIKHFLTEAGEMRIGEIDWSIS
jgi:hypothetical protein